MSVQRAVEFHEAIGRDDALRSRLQNAATPEERKQIITEAGFGDVTKEDIQATGELSEDELTAAAGAGIGDATMNTLNKIGTNTAAVGMSDGINSAVDEVSSWFDW